MAWAPLLLSLLGLFPASVAPAVLTQPRSLSEASGGTVVLTCTGNSNNVGYEGASWLQQQQLGQSPRLLVDRNGKRQTGIPERFSASRSGSSASLTVAGVRPEDEADYYCAAWDKSQSSPTVWQVKGEVRQKRMRSETVCESRGRSEQSLTRSQKHTGPVCQVTICVLFRNTKNNEVRMICPTL